ncbi:hypothetical protein HOP50_06g45410 [Chloropicon primus]|nr:hypothetical protein HOP50_06g45410 [Chloropicon primus]
MKEARGGEVVDMFNEEVDYEPDESEDEDESRVAAKGDEARTRASQGKGTPEEYPSNMLMLVGLPRSIGGEEVKTLFRRGGLKQDFGFVSAELYETGTEGNCAVVTLADPNKVLKAMLELRGSSFPGTTFKVDFVEYDKAFHLTLVAAAQYAGKKEGGNTALASTAAKLAQLDKLKVSDLKAELSRRGHSTNGIKKNLLSKLKKLVAIEEAAIHNLPPPVVEKIAEPNTKKAARVGAGMTSVSFAVGESVETRKKRKVSLECPYDILELVAGKREAKLRNVERESGVRIRVDRKFDPCLIEISGFDEPLAHASGVIGELIEASRATGLRPFSEDLDAHRISSIDRPTTSSETKQTIKCQTELLPLVLGKRPQLKNKRDIERRSGTSIYVFTKQNPCLIDVTGSHGGVADAIAALKLLIKESRARFAEETIRCPRFAVRFVIGVRGSVVSEIQDTANVTIDIDQSYDPCNVRITGDKECVAKALNIVRGIIKERGDPEAIEVVMCPFDLLPLVVGVDFGLIHKIEKETGAAIAVDKKFDPCALHVRGSRESVDRASAAIKRSVKDNESLLVSKVIDCPKAVVAYVIGKNGVTVSKVERDTGAKIEIDERVAPCKISITGLEENVTKAVEWMGTLIKEAPDFRETIECPYNIYMVIVGPQHATMRDIERETNTRIRADSNYDPCLFHIEGKKEKVIRACELVGKLVEEHKMSFARETVECGLPAIGPLLGEGGSNLTKIRKETQTFMHVDNDVEPCKINISGTKDHVAHAMRIVKEIIDRNTDIDTIECPKELIHVVVGIQKDKKFSNIINIQEACGIRVHVATDPDPCVIDLLGCEKGVAQGRQMVMRLINECKAGFVEDTLDCPKSIVGYIIGSRGTNVQKVEDGSGAKVQIRQDCDPCRIRVSGDRESVDKALELVKKLMLQSGGPRTETSVECPFDILRLVAGIEGQNLRTIERETHTRIDVDNKYDPCVIHIRGNDAKVADATDRIQRLMEEHSASLAEETLDCPRHTVGIIIGKGGTTVRKIEKDTGARVDIRQDCDPCQVHISGDRESVDKALEAVKKLLISDAPEVRKSVECPFDILRLVAGIEGQNLRTIERETHTRIDVDNKYDPCVIHIRGNDAKVADATDRIQRLMEEHSASLAEETLDCPRHTVGIIIGKGGTTVRKIEKDTGARVDIRQDCDPCQVHISGDRESVDKALEAVKKLLISDAPEVRKSVECPFDILRLVAGIEGQNLRTIERETHTRIDVDNKYDPCVIHIRGNDAKVADATDRIQRLMEEHSASLAEETLDCPRHTVGIIIGKGGTTVRKIEKDTGARVDIRQDCDPCQVHISGDRESVDKALEAVKKLLISDAPEVRKSVECPFDILRLVAGIEGQNLRTIERETHTRIDVDNKYDPCVIHIRGNDAKVADATDRIQRLMEEHSASLAEETLDCPRHTVGIIIGKGGTTVRKIEKDTGARVDIRQDCDPCQVHISGDRESVDKALEAVKKLLISDAPEVRKSVECPFDILRLVAGIEGQNLRTIERETHTRIDVDNKYDPCVIHIRGNDAKVADATDRIQRLVEEHSASLAEETLDCPRHTVGIIIGKGGTTVRKIEKDTGARVDIRQDCDPCQVHISGDRESVDKALEAVKDLRRRAKDGEDAEDAEDVVETLDCPRHCVGAIIGKGGTTVRKIEKDTGARVDIRQDCDPCQVHISGDRESVDKALEAVKDLRRRAKDGEDAEDAEDVVETLDCPRHCVGAIIGKGGTTVRKIVKSTGAKIKIRQDCDPCVAVVRGPRESVDKALEVVKGMMEEIPAPDLRTDLGTGPGADLRKSLESKKSSPDTKRKSQGTGSASAEKKSKRMKRLT